MIGYIIAFVFGAMAGAAVALIWTQFKIKEIETLLHESGFFDR